MAPRNSAAELLGTTSRTPCRRVHGRHRLGNGWARLRPGKTPPPFPRCLRPFSPQRPTRAPLPGCAPRQRAA
eukprot:1987606-Pyramimonas_sp.AAC.1